jgi:hypothetical protein
VGDDTGAVARLPGLVGADPEAIELANAYGPYTHGTWVSEDLAIGNEEALAGRGTFLVSHIRRALLEKFTIDELSSMTLVDVGCYDGWLLCQLEDLPFARIIGIEPRKKNLDKGRVFGKCWALRRAVNFGRGQSKVWRTIWMGCRRTL